MDFQWILIEWKKNEILDDFKRPSNNRLRNLKGHKEFQVVNWS